MAANGLAAVALLMTAWFTFASSASKGQRYSTAFLFLSLGLVHWLHAVLLAAPNMVDPVAANAARSLFSDWRIYAVEAFVALGAVVYLVVFLNHVGDERVAALAQEHVIRARHATQLHDGLVQDLAAVKLALERGDTELAAAVTAEALESAKRLMADWLDGGLEPVLRDVADVPQAEAA